MTPIRKGTARARVTIDSCDGPSVVLTQIALGEWAHLGVPAEAKDFKVFVVEIPEPYATLCDPRIIWFDSHEGALNWAAKRMESLREML